MKQFTYLKTIPVEIPNTIKIAEQVPIILCLCPPGYETLPLHWVRYIFTETQKPALDLTLPDPEFYFEWLPDLSKLVLFALRAAGITGEITINCGERFRHFCAEDSGLLLKNCPLNVLPGTLPSSAFDEGKFLAFLESQFA